MNQLMIGVDYRDPSRVSYRTNASQIDCSQRATTSNTVIAVVSRPEIRHRVLPGQYSVLQTDHWSVLRADHQYGRRRRQAPARPLPYDT